ncbi:ABC transporter permease [Aeromonas veronii]|uniref:ABC transporter permease n=1 Tax=Aeromonas veronii TaxID=654 RepID=UPI003B9F140D
MKDFSVSPLLLFKSLLTNRSLVHTLILREVTGRYKGSVFGMLWSFFNPVLMLVIYTFVFSIVFNARWGGGSESKSEFALILFAGLIVFNFFVECFNRAPTLILSNTNYVKKVVFPLELLPMINMGAALFNTIISIAVWIVFYFIDVGTLNLSILQLPLVLIPLCLMTMGVSWILSSLGVFIRDVTQFVGLLSTVIMFLSPIFYPASAIPEKYQIFLNLNPLSIPISQMRDILYWGNFLDAQAYIQYFMFSAVFAWCGYFWFQKTRKGFADVL